MSDPRLNSIHLEFPRRDHYRQARDGLLGARGWLTLAGACAENLVGEPDEWPSLLPVRPDQLLPGCRFVLLEPSERCAYRLKTGLNTIGRYTNNDIVLEDSLISRRHCVLLVHARGGCEVHDTASRNGTWVNGRRIDKPVQLSRGDRIGIQPRVLIVADADDWPDVADDDDAATDWA
jgi:hypothetical protein